MRRGAGLLAPAWRAAAARSPAPAGFAAQPARAEAAAPPLPPPAPVLDFNDTAAAFRGRSTPSLLRSLLVFRLCRVRPLVAHAEALLAASRRVLGATLTDAALRSTFYAQFVGGPDAEGMRPTLRALRARGVLPIMDYAAEDAAENPTAPGVLARQFEYGDEGLADRRMGTFMTAIHAAAAARDEDEAAAGGAAAGAARGRRAFAAIKVTALGPPALLERVSAALGAIRDLFAAFDAHGHGYVTREEFGAVYAELFTDATPARVDQVFNHLDANRDRRIDYLEWSQRVEVQDMAAIAARCASRGPFAAAALSARELELWAAMEGRLHRLAAAAAARGVRLMVDAEQTWVQPAIDAAVHRLQRAFNADAPVVFGTYQMYLRDAPGRLALDLERAARGGYAFGAKLVRGAYMAAERARAADSGAPPPVWASAAETHAAYDAAVAAVLPAVAAGRAEVMVATHNRASVEAAAAGMAAAGLPPGAGVAFGQLLGMADHLTFTLGAAGFQAYKYVPFGAVAEVVPYLLRRAQENADVLGGGARAEAAMLRAELRRRLLRGGA